MGTIQDRNGKDLTEVIEIKKKQQECTELQIKGLNDPGNHGDVVTHLQPDILKYDVKWESITTSKGIGGSGIPVRLFKILKHDAVKVPPSIYWQIWKTQQWPQNWKRSIFIPIPKKGNANEG